MTGIHQILISDDKTNGCEKRMVASGSAIEFILMII